MKNVQKTKMTNFQENLSRPGIIDAAARPFRNTALDKLTFISSAALT